MSNVTNTNKQTEDWLRTKSALINNIDKTIEKGSVSVDVLEEMKFLLENMKVKGVDEGGKKKERMELF